MIKDQDLVPTRVTGNIGKRIFGEVAKVKPRSEWLEVMVKGWGSEHTKSRKFFQEV